MNGKIFHGRPASFLAQVRFFTFCILCILCSGRPITAANYNVTVQSDGGVGSLRQAITCANVMAGHDTVSFNIPGAEPHTIQPLSALPNITRSALASMPPGPHI